MHTQLAKELVKTLKGVRQKNLQLNSAIAKTQSKVEKILMAIAETLQNLLRKMDSARTEFNNETEFNNKTEKYTSRPKPAYSSSMETAYNPFLQNLPVTGISFLEVIFSTIPKDSSNYVDSNVTVT